MRIISWNIRAGGGVRAESIFQQLLCWNPDVILLSEFRGTEPSQFIATSLSHSGYHYQKNNVTSSKPIVNSLLVASRWPLRTIRLKRAPNNPVNRWLHVNVASPDPVSILAVHIPNRVSGLKYPFMNKILDVVQYWRGPPAILMGDTNTGRIGIDEESPAFSQFEDKWMEFIDTSGWKDAFRLINPSAREFTWYSPNGNNGFRLDQAYLHPDLVPKIVGMVHSWGNDETQRRESLSDHAALILDLNLKGFQE